MKSLCFVAELSDCFNLGGAFALLLAPGHGFSASSVNYGGAISKDAERFLVGACPIVGSYGAKDRWAKGVAAELERILSASNVDHDVKEHSEAGHSFLNNHSSTLFKMLTGRECKRLITTTIR